MPVQIRPGARTVEVILRQQRRLLGEGVQYASSLDQRAAILPK